MRTTRFAFAIGMTLLLCACAATDSTSGANADVATVTVAVVPLDDYGGYLPPDLFNTATVSAEVRDARGNLVGDRPVTWELQLASGAPVTDSIASITRTGPLVASVRFHRPVVLAVVATVVGADNVARSGKVYVVPDASKRALP